MKIKGYNGVLGLDKILHMLVQNVECEDTKKLILGLSPQTELDVVKRQLSETADAQMLMGRYRLPSFRGLKNVTDEIKRAENQGLLGIYEILKVADVLQVFENLDEFRKETKSTQTLLDKRFGLIYADKKLKSKIRESIISDEEISDTASEELFAIRKKLRSLAEKVRDQLDKLIKSENTQKYLQEPIVTIRENRFVIPVKSEHRKDIAGLVHDTSSSGATAFIEPIGVVQANNEIKVLLAEEKKEIENILRNFSKEIGQSAQKILSSYSVAVELEMIFAKADLAYKMDAHVPQINNSGLINIKKARHPLIDPKLAVPVDVELGGKFNTLIITGPNTGGKTVVLKTVGLFTLMVMCGLLVPAAPDSEISTFQKVLCDIGDEQSIEQSLSTFSAHITNIIKILKLVDKDSLVLLDELGAGTDPVEGAALAIAILEQLKKKGAKTVATTHYAELKSYAVTEDMVENASCEFDVNTLRPTYRLLIGVPGSSNAFAISERLGLEGSVINLAKGLISKQDVVFDDAIKSIEDIKQEAETERIESRRLLDEIKKEKLRMEKDRETAKKQCENEIKKAREQADKIVRKTTVKAEEILEEIEKIKKEKDFSVTSMKKLKADMDLMEQNADPVIKKVPDEYYVAEPVNVGDEVLIFDIDKRGTVLEIDEKTNNAVVLAGTAKTRVPLQNLRLLKVKPKKSYVKKVTKNTKSKFSSVVNREINLRGKTALEAVMDLDSFIDSAVCTGVTQVTIIHGKGTGVLRKEIQKHLKNHPSVKSFRLGTFGEGESGVTIADLK